MAYADDIMIFTKRKNAPILINKINGAIESNSNWITNNRMVILLRKRQNINLGIQIHHSQVPTLA